MSFQTCTEVGPLCPVELTTYGYIPNFAANTIFLAVFAGCALPQLVLGIWSRAWSFTVALSIGCIMEAVGYAGRLMMHANVWDRTGFRIQVALLIIAPSFVAAGVYLSLKHIVLYLGPQHSRLRPRLYTWIFIGCDVVSILVQAAGGGIASGEEATIEQINAGNNLMIAGIAFQVVTMAFCGVLAVDFAVRYMRNHRYEKVEHDRHDESDGSPVPRRRSATMHRRFLCFCCAEVFAYLTVLVRCIYRIPEMAGGWGNELMRNEPEFLVLDGAMVALAVLALTVFHPSFWFPPMTGRGAARTTIKH